MIVLELLLTVAVIAVVVVLVIAVAGRGVLRSLAERWKFEGDVQRRVSAQFESAEADRDAMKEQAREFVERWFADKASLGEASGAVTVTPLLRQVLEKHHADEKVRDLAERYKKATGKDLLPPELIEKLKFQAGESSEASTPAEDSALGPEEEAAIAAARKEVEDWVNAQSVKGSNT
jgi:hypothetical protein